MQKLSIFHFAILCTALVNWGCIDNDNHSVPYNEDSVNGGKSDTDSTKSDSQKGDTGTGEVTPDSESGQMKPNDTETDTQSDVTLAPELAPLVPVKSCSDAWEVLRERFINQMVETVERNRASILERQRMSDDDCNEWYREDEEGDWDYSDGDTDSDSDSDSDSDGDVDGDADGAKEYSTTNNQVAGVDEADFMKNDGKYIYILADGAFQIVDAWPAAGAKIVSQLAIEGTPKKLFIYEGRAVIYSSLDPVNTTDTNFSHVRWYGDGECTYGYDCDFVGDGRNLKITVLDISEVTAPKVIRETKMNGSYLNARRIDSAIYTVVVFPELISEVPALTYTPLGISTWDCGTHIAQTEEEINAAYDALIAENKAVIEKFDFSATLPTITDSQLDGDSVTASKTLGGDCSHFFVSQTGDGNNLISVLGLDMTTSSDYAMASVVSRPGAVYADGDSLYLAMRHYKSNLNYWFYEDSLDIREATTVHKFILENSTASVRYQGSGIVKGRVLNQFSMDEYEDHLRIATTTGQVPSPDVHSTLSVLKVDSGPLTLTGEIDNIAPTEDIRSARFNGDRGFIVTFKKTDPLFVFDLADAKNPKIVGELKIPGYSTYMHMMDDTHILSIGFDAEDHGSFAYFQGIQLQIMDISDVSNPTLLHKEIIGTRGSTSDAATDHLAFNYFKSFDQLAIPMVVCEESSGGGNFGDVMTFSGLMVYKVTVEDGFDFIGGIPHATPEIDGEQSGMCSQWWSQGHSQVKRSIFMDDFVYSIAPDLINVSNIDDLEHPVSSVSLTIPDPLP